MTVLVEGRFVDTGQSIVGEDDVFQTRPVGEIVGSEAADVVVAEIQGFDGQRRVGGR